MTYPSTRKKNPVRENWNNQNKGLFMNNNCFRHFLKPFISCTNFNTFNLSLIQIIEGES